MPPEGSCAHYESLKEEGVHHNLSEKLEQVVCRCFDMVAAVPAGPKKEDHQTKRLEPSNKDAIRGSWHRYQEQEATRSKGHRYERSDQTLRTEQRALFLGARTLLGAPGLSTIRGSWHRYQEQGRY